MKQILVIILICFTSVILGQTTTTLTTTGSGTLSITIPCGVTTVTVDCMGGGGGGGGDNVDGGASPGGAGGGGGAYVTNTLAVTGNQVITFTIGAGGNGGAGAGNGTAGGATTFSNIIANGGLGGASNSGVATATVGGSGGTITNGAAGEAGGALGGEGGDGTGPGAGAGGVPVASENGGAGTSYGGGGAGGDDDGGGSRDGGAGAVGGVRVRYTNTFGGRAGVDQALAACTLTAALSATLPAGYTNGTWTCLSNCGTAAIANSTLASTTVSGLLSAATTSLQWSATHPSGCIATDVMVLTLPACPLTNNLCTSATSLTIGAGLICKQNTIGFNLEAGECHTDLGGPPTTYQSSWYRFTAVNDSAVLNFLSTNSAISPLVEVFGPFATGAGCQPACSSTVISKRESGDPGDHILLTGLATSGNRDYLVRVEGYANANNEYCINILNPASNINSSLSSVINNCGTTFNGTTNGGYFLSTSGLGGRNLDGNVATTCGACGTAGDDITFVVNNISWFKFCTVNAGTYNVTFDVGACVFSGLNSGSQMAILTGFPNNLTNISQAPNPTYPADPIWTSPNFTLAAGGCAYLVVDGFAGDACSYNYVLTNVSGGCILLPIELLSFNALQKGDLVDINWATATEKNNDYFTVERSVDGLNFTSVEVIDGAGTNSDAQFYSTTDKNPLHGISYYRLKQTDFDKKESYSEIISVDFKNNKDLTFDIVPNPTNGNTFTNINLNFLPKSEVVVDVYDIRGVLIYTENKKLESLTFPIPQKFDNGMYFVKITCNDFTQTKRLIIK